LQRTGHWQRAALTDPRCATHPYPGARCAIVQRARVASLAFGCLWALSALPTAEGSLEINTVRYGTYRSCFDSNAVMNFIALFLLGLIPD
jgi:hypothetical protein